MNDPEKWHPDYCAECKRKTARDEGVCVPCWARVTVAFILGSQARRSAIHRELRRRDVTLGGLRQQPEAMQKRRERLRHGGRNEQ